jgi:hypothetical protein
VGVPELKARVPTPRQEEALALRRHGASYADIARMLGITHKRARELIVAALKTSPVENIEEVRSLELERLDALFIVAFDQARDGSLGAIDRCLAIMNRRSQFLGLDAPKRHEVTTFDGESELDRSIRELLDRMASRGESGAPVETNGSAQATAPDD